MSLVMVFITIGAVAGPNLVAPTGKLAASLGLPPLAGPSLIAALACFILDEKNGWRGALLASSNHFFIFELFLNLDNVAYTVRYLLLPNGKAHEPPYFSLSPSLFLFSLAHHVAHDAHL